MPDQREPVLGVVVPELQKVAARVLSRSIATHYSQAQWEEMAQTIGEELRCNLQGSYTFLDALGKDDLHDGRGRVNKPAILGALEELIGQQTTPLAVAKYRHATEFLRRTFGL